MVDLSRAILMVLAITLSQLEVISYKDCDDNCRILKRKSNEKKIRWKDLRFIVVALRVNIKILIHLVSGRVRCRYDDRI